MRVRVWCGHRPTSSATNLYLEPGDVLVQLCGRRACEDAYNGTEKVRKTAPPKSESEIRKVWDV